ncbi:MAG: D-alanyl-D-alanine carboxypeptidase [Enterovirga sp.]|nr:D-alanyl-D-alanine carboxypeptidase [Enterovirga sp.]
MARRAALFVAGCLAFFSTWAAQAGTPALVVDAATGKVLVADRATDPWYPASVTKLMTAYVALDLVRQGKFSMNSLLTMSPEATREPPSKMGFKPGTQLTLENALRIIMVKSANDVSMMIGENLAGSVEEYSALMNEASRRLGMRESRWYNQNGLPDERQQTSARDMAILARALIQEFPEHDDLFRIGALKLGRQIIRNHNGMLGRYPGADGMKTGFICMGGFNIVASATKDGRRLIAVVMGYPSARERDLRAADLLDQGFASSGWSMQTLDQLPPSGLMSPPNMRSYVCGPNKRLPQEDDETSVVASAPSADNPIASLFAPSTYSVASAGAARPLSGRTSLGPRVAFEPIPIWLGATPTSVAEESPKAQEQIGAAGAKRVTSRKVRGRNVEPVAAAASLTPPVAGTNPGEGAAVTTLRSNVSPASRPALSANLHGKPAAEAKPKLGALGSGGKPGSGHGTIKPKPSLPTAALESAEIKKDAKAKPKPQAKPPAKPQSTAAKPAPRPEQRAAAPKARAAAAQ